MLSSTAKPRLRLVLATAIVLVAACATMQLYRVKSIEFPNKSGQLANGLRVTIQPDDSIPYVLAAIRYDVGSAFDPKAKKGVAHLTEHLAFRLGDELVEVERASGSEKRRAVRYLVDENAWTTLDETVYWKQVTPYHLEDVLESFARHMGDFAPEISRDVFETEREVVRNERRASYEGMPLNQAELDLYERFYPADHPYQGQKVIGSHETIAAIELADVREFVTQHYHPTNATLLVMGPVDEYATLAMIQKHFGDKPRREPSRVAAPDWSPTPRRETIVVPRAKESMLTVVWPLPPRHTDDVAAARILSELPPTSTDDVSAAQILSGTGWFNYRLAHNRGWAYWAYSDVVEQEYGSLFVVKALLKDHGKVDAATRRIFQIAEIAGTTVKTPSDVAQPRRRVIYEYLYDAESPQARAETVLEYFSQLGRPMGWAQEFDRLERLSPTAVRNASHLLVRERAMVFVHTPLGEEAVASPQAGNGQASYAQEVAEQVATSERHEDRDRPPAVYRFEQPFADYHAWAVGGAAKWQEAPEYELENGLRYRVITSGTLPVMHVKAAFHGGLIVEDRGRTGVAQITLDSVGLSGRANRVDQFNMGVRYSNEIRGEYIAYGQKFLSSYADDGLRLFAKGVRSPKFLLKSLNDRRDLYLQDLGGADRDIDALAARAFWKARGLEQLAPIATQATVGNVRLGDVERYYGRVVYPENGMLTVASNLPAEEVRALVERHFGGWASLGRAPLEVGRIVGQQEPSAEVEQIMGQADPSLDSIVAVSVPGSVQSKLLLGFDAPGWSDWKGQYLALGVSKLLEEKISRLPEDMGVAYDAKAATRAWHSHGVIGVTTKVEHGATHRALEVLLAAVDGVRTTPVTDGEADFIRRSLLKEATERGHTLSSATAGHIELMRKSRPRGHVREAIDWIAGLETRDIQAAVDGLLGGQPTLVVAGEDPKIPEERTGAFARFSGPVRYLSADELL